jgi:hypothetical protein
LKGRAKFSRRSATKKRVIKKLIDFFVQSHAIEELGVYFIRVVNRDS